MVHVLWITEYFPQSEDDITGGVEARTWNLAKHLSVEHNITIIASWRKGYPRKQILGNLRVLRVGPHHPYTSAGSLTSRLAFLRAAIRVGKTLHKPDLVEGHNFISYLPAHRLATHFKVPALATYHEVWLGKWKATKGLITGTAGALAEHVVLSKKWNHIISVSNFTRLALQKQGVSKRRITMIPNGVDLVSEPQRKYSQPTVCYAGRLTNKKRVNDLIKAMSIVKKTVPKVRLMVVGEGEEKDKLIRLARNLKINALFTGFLRDKKEVQTIFERSRVFCSPSILEGFGITVIEAAASGTPYVISDIEPFKEVTCNGIGGFIVKKKSPQHIARAIIKLLKDRNFYQLKRAQGKRLAQQYEWGYVASQVSEVYSKVAKSFIKSLQRGK